MYKSKNITGFMSVPDLLRQPDGTALIYYVNAGIQNATAQRFIQSYVARMGAQIEQQRLIVTDPVNAESRLAIQVTVLKSAQKKAPN